MMNALPSLLSRCTSMHNMFGFTDKEGLVDSFDATEFDVDVGELKEKWNQREEDCLLSCSRTPQL